MSEQPALTRVVRLDSLPITKAQYTKEGYLIDTPILTSVGIFEYKNGDGSVRRELRLPEHVFAPESLASYEGKPIIVTHDAGTINKNNVEDESIGTILSKGFRDGDDVRARIVVHDTNELKRCGLKELSLGYTLDLVEEPGEWNGQPYDAVQTNIIINHLALVANARAGEQARLNIDGKEDPKPNKGGNTTMATKKSRRRDEDDLAVQLAQAVLEESASPDATAGEGGADNPIEAQGGEGNAAQTTEDILASIRERKDRRDSDQENGPQNLDEANEVIKQQNEDIDALLDMLDKKEEEQKQEAPKEDEDDEENEDEDDDAEEGNEDDDDEDDEGTNMNADSIDAIVRARTALIRIGEKFNIDGLEKASMKDAMCKVIAAASPNIRLDSDAEIKGAFKVAVATLEARKDTNYQRKQIASGMRLDSRFESESDNARERMIERMMKGE